MCVLVAGQDGRYGVPERDDMRAAMRGMMR